MVIHKAENKNIQKAKTIRKKTLTNNRFNVYKRRQSMQTGNNAIEVKGSNSSERAIINKFQPSRNKKYNFANEKTGTNSNLVKRTNK